MSLPPFLRPLVPSDELVPSETNVYLHATLPHSDPLGSAHAIWWPSTEPSPDVILFIPANLAILAHAHLGHTPTTIDQDIFRNPESVALENQLKSVIEAFDAIKLTLNPKRVMLISHSVGGWLGLQVQVLKARPNGVSGAFLLFPTICDMSKSPNGRLLSRLFRPPVPYILASISPLLQLVPFFILRLLFWDWSIPQLRVLRSLLHSPTAIYASLTMAHDEMIRICDLDVDLMNEHRDRIWLYFAEYDGWVGDSRQKIMKVSDSHPESFRVAHGRVGIPHAFCINYGRTLARQCLSWMQSEYLL